MSLINHNDTEGKIIASGGVVVRKEHSYAEMNEVQLNVNQNQFSINTIGNRIIKFELRRTPRNERMEDLVISWEEFNPTGVDYEKMPCFWENLQSVRVLINNKEVVDLKTPEGIRNQYRTNLWTRNRDRTARDYHWAWITRGQPFIQDYGVVQPLINAPTIPAGESRTFNATINDLLGGIFEGLPMDKIFLIEIECQIIQQDKAYLIGENAEASQTIVRNIQAWAKMKLFTLKIKQPFSNWTLFHHEHEVLRITSPSPIHGVNGGILNVDLHTLIPRRTLIQRIIVYIQNTDFDVNGYKAINNNKTTSLRLERNGDDVLATRQFYKDRFEILRASHKYYKRHHGGVSGVNSDATGGAGDYWGNAFPEFFIDTTPVLKTINASPILETKVQASEGIDNHTNLNLIVQNLPNENLGDNENLIIIVEWCRYDRINPSGNVIRIQTP